MIITAIETKNKWEKMACKYRTMRNGEKSEKHKWPSRLQKVNITRS